MKYVPDTHALVWFMRADVKISEPARNALRDPTADISIPAIVLAEVRFLSLRGRIQVSLTDVLDLIRQDSRVTVLPLSDRVVAHMPKELNIHDGLIVATALYVAEATGDPVAVITKDRQIRDSGLVPTVW